MGAPGQSGSEVTFSAADDERFMREALALAREAALAGEVPVGAVAVLDGRVVAAGRNRVEELHSVSAHAEFEVVRQLEARRGDWRMSDVDLYVTKEPCPMCAGMLVNCRVRRIVFGVADPAGGGCGGALDVTGCPTLLWRPEVSGGILAEDARRLLREFFRTRRSEKKPANE